MDAVAVTDVLLIRGAPGSGKSTLAEGLRAYLGAVIEVDALRGMICGCDWTDPGLHAAALGMAVDGALRLVFSGVRPVAIVDTFAWRRHPWARAEVEFAGAASATVSLWADAAEIERRLGSRASGHRDVVSALALNGEIAGDAERVDTTNRTPGDVVALVLARLGERRSGISATVVACDR